MTIVQVKRDPNLPDHPLGAVNFPETHAPLKEPASVPQPAEQADPGAGSTPSAVEQHEAMLTVEWAKLSDRLKFVRGNEAAALERKRVAELQAKAERAEWAKERCTVTAEMDKLRKLLATHARLKSPRKRAPK